MFGECISCPVDIYKTMNAKTSANLGFCEFLHF